MENESIKLRGGGTDSPGKGQGDKNSKRVPGVWNATEHKKGQNIGRETDRGRQRQRQTGRQSRLRK